MVGLLAESAFWRFLIIFLNLLVIHGGSFLEILTCFNGSRDSTPIFMRLSNKDSFSWQIVVEAVIMLDHSILLRYFPRDALALGLLSQVKMCLTALAWFALLLAIRGRSH